MTISDATTPGDMARIQALLHRPPGYAVAAKCLEVQGAAEEWDPTLRTERGVRLAPDAWSWMAGALGEIHVGQLLERLGPEWFVRHAVPIGAGTEDVDHLLIGPPGVFALNTKYHRHASVWVGDYTVQINGHNKRYLQASVSEAADVSRRLTRACGFPVHAHPVLVMVDAKSITDRRAPSTRTVSVAPASDLVRWLYSLPRIVSDEQLGLIRLEAEDPGLWHVDLNAADTFRVMARFDRLYKEVGGQLAAPPTGVVAPVGPMAASSSSSRGGRTPPSRVVLTAVLTIVALAIAIPVTMLGVTLVASGALPWYWLPLGVFAVGGLLSGGGTTRRRGRR